MNTNVNAHQTDTMRKFSDIAEECKFTAEERKQFEDMKDSRDISNELMDEFMNGAFKAFREFALTHDDLAICFRGNGSPESIIIYHFNHVVWELYLSKRPLVKINFDHARYLEDWKHYMSRFCSEKLGFREEKLCKKEHGEKKTSSATIGELTCSSGKYDEDFVEDTYKLIVEKMMESFFNPDENTDYFRRSLDMKQPDGYSKSAYIEKRWQHSLFKRFQKSESTGLFLYDLEFSQKFPSTHIRAKLSSILKGLNEPDMLGIRYESGKAAGLVLVEVKSTESACTDSKAGIGKHLEKMYHYSQFKELTDNRKKDVPKILKRYRELGILKDNLQIPEELSEDFPVERLLILTNCTVPETNGADARPTPDAVSYFKRNETKLTPIAQKYQCDIWLVKGNYDENFEIERKITWKDGADYNGN